MVTMLVRIAAMVVGALLAQDGTAPAPSGAPVGGEPAQVTGGNKLSTDSSVDQVLEALERRGQGLKDFTADVVLEEKATDLGSKTIQKGTAVYQKKGEGDARVRVVFKSKQEEKKIFDEKTEYLLDDGWLTDRDYKRKSETRRQVAGPGEKIDLLKLGEGPFPLPVGQSPESVKKLFEVTKGTPDAKKDPADSVHIVLTPRPDTSFAKKFKKIDVWVDVKTEMPKRVRTLSDNEQTERTTDLDVKGINKGLKDGDFALDAVDGAWDRHTTQYEE